MPLSMVKIFEKFVEALPEGHQLTGFTFEVSSKIGNGHLIRCNGGTYNELLNEFKGTEDDFIQEMLKGYQESQRLAKEKFDPIVKEAEGSDDTQSDSPKNP